MLRKLASDTLAYGITGVISRFIGFLLVPVFTRVFSPQDYGVVSLVTTLFTLFSILTVLGLDNSIARWYYDDEVESSKKISLNTFLWSCVTVACVIGGMIILFRTYIARHVLESDIAESALLVAGLNLPLAVFTTFSTNVLRIQQRPVATSVFTVLASLLTVSASIWFVVVSKVGFIGVFHAQLLTSAVLAIVTCVFFRGMIDPRMFSLTRWKQMFRFSAPLIPGSVAFWVINLSGVYFLQLYWDSAEVGLYQVGLSIASSMLLLTGAFQLAWGPFAFSIHKQPGAKDVFAKTLELYTGSSTLAAVALTLFGRELMLILTTPQYAEAYWVVGMLAFNYVLTGLGYVANIGPSIVKNNRSYGIATVASAILFVILNIILVPRFAREGAAAAVVISQLMIPVIVFARSQSLYPISYNFPKATLILLGGVGIGFGTLILLNQVKADEYYAVGIKSFILFSFAAVLFQTINIRRQMVQAATS